MVLTDRQLAVPLVKKDKVWKFVLNKTQKETKKLCFYNVRQKKANFKTTINIPNSKVRVEGKQLNGWTVKYRKCED